MISPEILKRAATAGALGAAVLGGAVWMTVESESIDCDIERSRWGSPVEVSYGAEERLPPPVPVARKAPPPTDSAAEEAEEPVERGVAEARARKEAMRRAIDQLTRLKRVEDASRAETVRRLEVRIDRAIREAADRSRER